MKSFLRVLILGFVVCFVLMFSLSANAKSPILHRYSTGKRVGQLQWLLSGKNPSAFKIQAYRGPVTRHFDLKTVRAVENMKYRLGWPKNRINGTAGPFLFKILLGKTNRLSAWKREAGRRVNAQTKFVTSPLSVKVQTLINDANYLIGVNYKIGYTQTALRMTITRKHLRIPPLNQYIWEDCSSSVTGLYYLANLPDPNGYTNPPYPGWGYTGTLASHGRVVWHLGQSLSLLRPGDLIFYGGGFPHHHVTMYLGNGRVFSHGTNIGPFNLPVLYRNDAVGAHRYVNVG